MRRTPLRCESGAVAGLYCLRGRWTAPLSAANAQRVHSRSERSQIAAWFSERQRRGRTTAAQSYRGASAHPQARSQQHASRAMEARTSTTRPSACNPPQKPKPSWYAQQLRQSHRSRRRRARVQHGPGSAVQFPVGDRRRVARGDADDPLECLEARWHGEAPDLRRTSAERCSAL